MPARAALIALLSLPCLGTSALADAIYSVTDAPTDTPTPLCLGGDCFSQVLMASWTSEVAFNNVSILGEFGGDSSSASLTAFLTNKVGPGATAANQIASVTLTPPSADSPGVMLFSGLNLGPGTYYVVLTGPVSGSSYSYWYEYNSPTISTAGGVTAGSFGMANAVDSSSSPSSAYPPASTFDTASAPVLSIQVVTAALQSQTITFAPLSNLTFTSLLPPLNATASSGLPVTFTSNSTQVCTVSGVSITLVAVGTCSITASQVGNATYAPAPSITQTFTVSLATQTIAFPAIPNVVYGAAPITITATASSGLPVTFASTSASVCTVSGANVTLIGAGICSLTASQPGNANYAAAQSVTETFTVSTATQTITFPALSSLALGTVTFSLNATASSGLAVIFVSNTTSVCTVSSANVTLVATGTCSITANQPGNANYAAAASVVQSFMVTEASQTITFETLRGVSFGAAPFALSAIASSGLPVVFASSTNGVCSLSGNMVTIVAVGTCSITALQAGNATYAAAPSVTQTVIVSPATQTITFAAIDNVAFGSVPINISATASSGLPVTFLSTTPAVCTVSGAVVTIAATGTCSIAANQAGNADYSAAPSVTQSFTIGLPSMPAPLINSNGIVPVYSYSTTIQPGEWVSIYGSNLATGTATWTGSFPTSLGGTTVTINGKLAYLWFVSPGQINLQAPDDTSTGVVPVVVTTAVGTATSSVTLAQFGPSFSLLDNKHVAGIILRPNGSGAYGAGAYDILGPTGTSLGYSTVAAKAGDSVVLFGVGFGPTNPAVPAGQAFSGAAPTTNPVNLLIDNAGVTPAFAGMSGAGLYQINLTVPSDLGTGDVPLMASVGGAQTPSGVVISLQ